MLVFTHLDVCAEVDETHDFAKLMLLLEVGELLLLAKWYLICILTGDPWMKQGCGCVVALRRGILDQVEEEVLG